MFREYSRKFKIIILVAVILALIGAIFYLVYSFYLIWQAMAAGITIGFLLILVFLLIVLAVYLWMRILWMKRDLNKYMSELERLKRKEEALVKKLEKNPEN